MKNFYAITLKKISIYIWVVFLCFGSSVYAKSSFFLSNHEKAAKQGDDSAQYSLGDCYKDGKGVVKDEKKAVYWYEKAAEQGNRYTYKLIDYYYKDLKDYKKAAYWCKKAHDKGLDVSEIWEEGELWKYAE